MNFLITQIRYQSIIFFYLFNNKENPNRAGPELNLRIHENPYAKHTGHLGSNQLVESRIAFENIRFSSLPLRTHNKNACESI